MQLLGSFTYECNGVMRTAEAPDGSIVRAAFDPEPCTGTHAYSIFKDSKGAKVHEEITLAKYEDIGRKGGFARNPIKNETQSLFGKAFTPRAEAAIAFDNAIFGNLGGAGTSFTYSFTTTGSNILLFSFPRCANQAFTSLTYNAVASTQQHNEGTTGGINATGAFYQFNAASGANNVVITCAASADDIVGVDASYTGTASPLDGNGRAGVTVGATSMSLTITSTSTAAWMIAGFRSAVGGAWTLSSGTNRNGTQNHIIVDSGATTTCASPSCTLRGTHDAGDSLVFGITVDAAVAAAAAPVDDTSFEIMN
ncbi:MAG: hypothetical protein Q6360_13130 [Candidatus Brocadiales bacterium]|nr:hypothetical protein [Candidatus Brocadiales bacterium]